MVYGLHLGVHPENNAFLLQCFLDAGSNVTVFARNQFRIAFKYCHLRAEGSIHGCKFQSDITTTDNHKMTRKIREFHNGSAGINKRIVRYAVNGWNDRFRSCINNDLLSCQQ